MENEDVGWEQVGLDEQLIRALRKKDISCPTPIQSKAIPFILEGKDVVAQAKTGSGKTYAYILPLLHHLLKLYSENKARKAAPNAFILVPTRELCQQVNQEVTSFLGFCKDKLKVVQLTVSMPLHDMTVALSGPPNIVVTTPACISTCISKDVLKASTIKESLSMLILDEADLLLSYGYEADLKALITHIPRSSQCILMSATSSNDVTVLKKLFLHNPVTLTLTEGGSGDSIVPSSIQQFWISCEANDKLLYMLALLKFELVRKKVLIFLNTIESAFKVKLFLEKFGIRSAVLNAELPQNSRLHIIEEFNAGLFDYLIAADIQTKEKDQISKDSQVQRSSKRHPKKALDAEFGVVRGIDFKNVFTVVNFDMPLSPAGYIHRIGRTGRAFNAGASISLVSPIEEQIFEEIKCTLNDSEDKSELIAPFLLLTKNAVESLRYRAQDVARSVTSRDIQDARHQDLKNEILNSEKLKSHFEENPKDLDLLKHDKILCNKPIPAHLRDVPEYLVDAATQEASKIMKLSNIIMGTKNSRKRGGFKRGFGRSRDPLRTFSSRDKRSKRKTGDGASCRRRKHNRGNEM